MLGFAFAAFLVFGAVLVLVGANQAAIARDLALDLERTGLLASALALGIGVGVLGTGPLADRFARWPQFVAAALLAAAALLLVDAHMGFARAFLHVAAAGLALGMQSTLLNASIADRYRGASARPMLLAHSAATLGAVLAPPLVGLLLARELHWTTSFRALGVAYIGLAAAGLAVRLPHPPAGAVGVGRQLSGVLTPGIVPFALVGFAYLGVEASLTIFAVPYAGEALHLDEGRGLAAISALWLGLLLGRLALLAVRARVDARFLVGAGLAGAVVLALGAGARLPQLELVFGVTGLSLGFVFPVMVALAADRFPTAAGSASGVVVGSGAIGGFVIPWLHGALGDRIGVAGAVSALVVWSLLIAAAAASALRGRRS